jgi:hypothetical protein
MPIREVSLKNLLAELCLCLFLVVSIGCVSRDEVARVTSPSGKVDAVLVETNGGATTSFGYEVFIVPTRASIWLRNDVASFYGAVRSDEAYGVNLKWSDPSNVNLEYLKARQQEVLIPTVSIAGQEIHVTLKSGVSDPKAPRGGMLYNLRGRPHDR